MEEKKGIKPFAITAKKIGVADSIYTKILVVNAEGDNLFGTFVNALWDTGSPICLIFKSLANLLQLKPVNSGFIRGVGGPTVISDQRAYINIVSNGDIIPVYCYIIEDIPNSNCSFIVGMNFISKGSMALSFDGKETTFSFIVPPEAPIDFIKNANDSHTVKYQKLSYGRENLELISNRELARLIHGLD